MANTLEAYIIRVLTETRDEIRANMQSKKINASGRTSASLRVEAYEGGVRLVGGYDARREIGMGIYTNDTAPIPTLEFGRDGGKVPKGFYYIIKEWTREKGLRFSSESERGTFAYFVAQKIAREGTKRNKQHEDVYSTPVSNARGKINEIINASVARTIRAAIGGQQVQTIQGAFA